jgi:hypothetical protein
LEVGCNALHATSYVLRSNVGGIATVRLTIFALYLGKNKVNLELMESKVWVGLVVGSSSWKKTNFAKPVVRSSVCEVFTCLQYCVK